jgi:hypothetical protein
MYKRRSIMVPGWQFNCVISQAQTGTLQKLKDELKFWMDNSTDARRISYNGKLDLIFSNTLLEAVVGESDVEVAEKVKFLVCQHHAEVDLCKVFESGQTLLQRAVFSHRTKAVLALLVHGADPNRIQCMYAASMYVYAAEKNLIEVFMAMTRFGADIYQTNSFEESAIVMSVRHGHLEITTELLKRGVTSDWYTFEDRMTLLHWAVENRTTTSTAMIKLLLDSGANPNLRSFRPAGYTFNVPGCGFTPLQYLMDTDIGVSRYTEFTENELQIVKTNAKLLEDTMDTYVCNRRLAVCMVSNTRLSSKSGCLLASIAGEPSLLKLIMDKTTEGFDINHPENPLPAMVKYTGIVETY